MIDSAETHRELLIDACLAAWASGTPEACSSRAISGAARVPGTSIYNIFGSMEQLFYAAHKQALAEAQQWCAVRLAEFDEGGLSPGLLGAAIAAVIDDWCRKERRTAFAFLECRLAAARQIRFLPLIGEWRELWLAFWAELCGRFELDHAARLTTLFFLGESSFHLLEWRRSWDRAALDESCAGWGNWMQGQRSPPAPWRDLARRRAVLGAPALAAREPATDELGNVAADLVVKRGFGGLTFRALATESGKTLGFVSHRFSNSAELYGAAFAALYRRNNSAEDEQLIIAGKDSREIVSHLVKRAVGVPMNRFELDELLMICARNEFLRSFGANIRYCRGGSGIKFLSALLGSPVSSSDAALFSIFMSGVTAFYLLRGRESGNVEDVENDIRHLIEILHGN